MSLFHRKPKVPRHNHDWQRIHHSVRMMHYIQTGPFGGQHPFSIEVVTRLLKCASCGEERGYMERTDGREFIDVRDVPPGFILGGMDGEVYRAKFMQEGKP